MEADIFLSWQPLVGMDAPPKRLLVHVYEIKGLRPYSSLALDSGQETK